MKNKVKLWIGVGAYVLTNAGYGAVAANSNNLIADSLKTAESEHVLAQGGEGGEGGEGTAPLTPPVVPDAGGEGIMVSPTPLPDAGGEGGEGGEG